MVLRWTVWPTLDTDIVVVWSKAGQVIEDFGEPSRSDSAERHLYECGGGHTPPLYAVAQESKRMEGEVRSEWRLQTRNWRGQDGLRLVPFHCKGRMAALSRLGDRTNGVHAKRSCLGRSEAAGTRTAPGPGVRCRPYDLRMQTVQRPEKCC